MPKALTLHPRETRRAGHLHIHDIPLHSYDTPIEEECKRLGPDGPIRILRDMLLIREFESMLDCLKRGNEYGGTRYTHLGPAPLAIGQEAVAVGQAFLLGPDDHIFGSHRSH